jgi:hypothetical protein
MLKYRKERRGTMFTLLAVFGGVIGLAATGVAVFTAWFVFTQRNHTGLDKLLLQWTVFDYTILGLFLIGMLFLFTDLLGVYRERANYPLFHFSYLLCGFVFMFLGMLFIIVRLAVVIKLAQSGRPLLPDQHEQPNQTNHTE